MYYTSSEFLNSMASTSNMQAKPEVPKSNRMKRRSCEVPLAEVPNAFKISLNDISNISNYDTNSLKSFKTIVDGRLIRTYRPVYGDNRSFKSYRASISDFSNFDSISIPPPYDKQSRRSFNMESNDGHGMTSSIEGVLWSDEEENEYFYKEGITAAFNQDLAAIRQLLESETGSTTCPSCNMPFDKGKKRKLIDACGHERCYSCMFRNEICPLCVRAGQKTSPQKSNWESPSPQIRKMEQWENQNKMQKPPKPTTCPTPPNTRRRFFLSPKSLRSQFGQRGRITQENHVPLSGVPEERSQPTNQAWRSIVFNKIRSLWSTNTSMAQGLNQLAPDDEGGHVKTFESRRQSDLYMRLGLLLGEKKRGKSRDSCTSLASFDNTSPVSTLTGSSETDAVSPLGRDSLGSLASMSLSNYSVSSPGSRRHINGISMEKSKSEEFNRTASGFFKNRKTAARRSGRSSSKQSSASSTTKSAYSSQAINLRPLFFEVPSTDPQADFIGRHWLFNDITKILDSSSQGIVISGIQGTGKTALILQLVEYSCFGRKRCLEYEEVRETCEIRQLEPEDEARENFTKLAHSVVGYHFCQADNNSTCLVGEFVHSIAAQLCQSPRLQSYREHLINEPDLLSCLSLKECIADPGTAFTRGIIEPLVELRKNGQIDKSNNIILVDGLCEAEYHRPDHGYTIISFLVKHMSEIPSWFKIITTMRTELLELSKQLPFTRLSIDVCDNVQKDLFEYFNSRIRISPIVETNIRFTTGKNDSSVYKFAQYVIHLSRGSFLFLKLTLDLIEKSHIVIKSLNYKVVPISLAQIFLLQFNLKFPTVQSFEKVSHILSVCLAALYPLTLVEIYYSVNSLLVNKFLPWEEFCQRFEMLTDFLVKRIDNTYMFFHPSFREWLVRRDDGESIKFLCDLRAGHCGIAYRLSRVQAPLDSEKTLELGHHILKAHMYRNMSPTQLGLCPRDLQAALVASSSSNVGDSIANLRNIYTPNVKVSRLFLLAGGSPNHITSCLGEAPLLCIYSYQGILVMVGLLLEFGADLEGTNSQGCTAVSLACQRGHTDVVKRLIAAGASLTHPDTSGQTPLVHAAKNGHRDTMIYMIGYCQSNGIYDLDEIGAKHALMVAAQNGHLEIVEYLLDTAEISVLEECPRSKLCVTVAACMGGNTEVLEAVLWRGAKVCERSLNEAVRQSRPTRSTLLSKLLHGINEIPTLPVVLASAAGHDDAISMLLEYGGDPNSVDADGMSALGWACLRGHVSTVKLLLNRGASIEGCGSRAPLSLACGGDVALAEVLLSSGATLERVDHNGLRPLDRAVGLRNAPLVQFFLRRGAKLGPSTWVMASDKPDFMLILLNKLLEDGNTLYRKNHISEAAHRYQYALKKIASLIDDENRAQGLTQDQLPPFLQLKTNLLLNLSRCKRKINEPEEALELAEKACALRPDTFESSYARARALLQLSRPHEAAPYARRAVQLASPHHAPVAHDLLRRTLQFQH